MKKIKSLILILVSLSTIQGFSQTNIALNKPAFASGEAVPNWNHKRIHGNDGDMKTRWQGTESAGTKISEGLFNNPSWFYSDLGNNFQIEGVRIFWEAAYAIGFTIDVSTDASAWKTVFTQNDGKGSEELAAFSPINARYVRISILRGNMQWYPSFWEMEVYQKDDLPLATNYQIDFDKGMPAELSFLSNNPLIYENSLTTISGSDKTLRIKAHGQQGATFVWDSIYTNFSHIGGLRVLDNKYVYLRYKADRGFILKVLVEDKNKQLFETKADTLPPSSDNSVYWYNLNLPAELLKNIHGFVFNIGSQGEANIDIDFIQVGSLSPKFKFGFTQPFKGAQFSVGDKVNLLTNGNVGKVKYFHNGSQIDYIQAFPYNSSIENIQGGYHKIKAELYNSSDLLIDSANVYVYVKHEGGGEKLDYYTTNLYQSLKAMAKTGHTMFGMANPTTIGYNSGPKNTNYNTSDCKDITGSHPGFHESDFMWYDDEDFKRGDITAMKDAVYRGAVIGYCYHLAGSRSNSFNAKVNGANSADYNLVSEILSNSDRTKNAMLDWYLTKLDNVVIPILKDISVPVVYRPFHEMTGDWFWWGRQVGSSNYIKIFQLTVDYMRAAGLKNVLYSWSPDGDANFQFYPGDNYVDILGYDAYEPGIASWMPHSKVKTALTTLINYANSKDKVAAWTETGCRMVDNQTVYPNKYYDFWSKYVWDFTHDDSILRQLAWIETWYNANWNHSTTGSGYIPHKGSNMPNADKAAADFIKMYNYPQSIFENDMLDMYGMSNLSEVFVYPANLIITENNTYSLIGGTSSGWFNNEAKSWSTLDPSIAMVDSNGKLTAIKKGKTSIVLRVGEKVSSMEVEVCEPGFVAVKQQSIVQINISPNPVTQNGFTLQAENNNESYFLTIFTMSGQEIYAETSDKSVLFVNTTGFENGIYLVKLTNKQKTLTTKLIISYK